MKPRLKVALVGATGAVGREILDLLERRPWPPFELSLFASGKPGRRLTFRGRSLAVQPSEPKRLSGFDLALFATDDAVVLRHAPRLAREGTVVIDESAAFRMEPGVPLVIPEINGHVLRRGQRLIAGPNCTTAALLMGVYPLHKHAPLRSLRAATYQAVSGAGRAAVEELALQVADWSRGRTSPRPAALPQRIAFNIFPHIGSFNGDGWTSEETKIAQEARKILALPRLRVSATAVRVPVFRGHSIAAWVETARPVEPRRVERLLAAAPGVKLVRRPGAPYPTPLDAAGRGDVYVGRVRRGENARETLLWIVGDNLLKGAALNSVQIAELLLKKGWLKAGRLQ